MQIKEAKFCYVGRTVPYDILKEKVQRDIVLKQVVCNISRAILCQLSPRLSFLYTPRLSNKHVKKYEIHYDEGFCITNVNR